ncbi:ATP-binding protein [Marinobacter apostichopi]|uniref:ATP-binding protein n=1 Tax=Marinobacter apostichopi TaxID=3035454 RepID=UPI0025729F5E|nr:sensor histidine kinase [Marinobacter sp. LA51]
MTPFKKPTSIKRTLLALLLPSGIALMAIAWLIHGILLERMSQDFVESRLKDEVAFLEHQIRQSDGKISALQTGDYFQEVFHHAFAIQSPTQTLISPQNWGALLSPLLEPGQQGTVRVRNSESPSAPGDILAFRKSFRVNNQPIVVIVAEDMAALHNSQAELHAWTAIVSILLILLLVGVIWIAIALSMRPIGSLQAALKKLQTGETTRIHVRAPEEFRPLVQQLNQVLDSLDQRLERSRDALANLSHSVKTPIAAVRQVLEDTSRALDDDLRQEMGDRLASLDKQLEAEMRRSRFAGPQAGKNSRPVDQARDLLWMLGRLYPEKSFELSTELTEETHWPLEQHDLNEILGNLLDNAGKWSAHCVELRLMANRKKLTITISDDGPGVAEEAISQLGKRGLRLDEQISGHGLGLAIVNDIVSRYGGNLIIKRNKNGGLSATVELVAPSV